MLDYEIHGGKGGDKKPHTPVETPNNLLSVAYAKVLIAVAEGELAGTPTDQDIFLDGTPLANPDGSKNFGGVKWEWRNGSSDQTYIAGLPEVSTEYNVGVELKADTPWVRNITKTQLDAVRVTFQWPALYSQESNGDTVGVSMDYAIDVATDGGTFVEYQRYNINGKTNTAYERTHRINLPAADSGWIIRARKLTADTTVGTIQDTMNVKSYAEVVDVKQRYPNTALLYVEFDSRMFGGGAIPKVSVRTKGRVIRVPDNYDPITRSYSGVWSGAFKWAWSDNPAWVFQDIITQDRFGLGNKVSLNMVDKWALYEIAQHCDVMVDDGHNIGVMQPRATINIYIQDKMDAWQVLRDIATIFNGMTYWNGNQFTVIADKQEPLTNLPVFSRSNVVNGEFNYAAADDKSIYTSALVSYDDPDNHYNTEVESTFETEQILRWGGDRQLEISAIGCTSRGEAQRRGKYALLTNMFNRTVTFRTGLQGLNDEVMPGKLIHVVDPLIGGRPFTGRIKIAVGKVLTLDRDVDASAGDIMYITKADGSSEGRTVASVAGNIVTLQVAYTELPLPNAVWYLEAADLKSQLFRVTKITSPEESVYEIQGVEYNDSKYAAIDTGARLEPRPISVTPPNIQQPPTAVTVTSRSYIEQTMAVNTMVISWNQTQNAVGYEVQWKVSDGDWINAGTTGATEFSVKGIYTGKYIARVRAINAFDIKSIWTTSALTTLNGKTGTPPSLTSLTVTPIVFGMKLNWTFPAGATDTDRTEVMYSQTPQFINAIKLGDFSYPQNTHEMNGLKAGQQFFFWARLVDKTGNVGPYFPLTTVNGVMGQSSTNFNEYEEYFKDQINNSALGQELAERIDLIDGPAEMIGSVNERVEGVKDQVDQVNSELTGLIEQTNTDLDATNAQLAADKAALQAQIDATNQTVTEVTNDLQEQIDGIQDLADSIDYIPANTYTTGQSVLGTDKRLYQAKQNVPINTPPPNTTYWTDIGQVVSSADGLAARVSTVETTVTNQDGRITANANAITGLTSSLAGKADASALTSLTTRVTTAEGTITSQGNAITGLTSTVAGKADTSALNSLTTRVTAAEGLITSQGNAITSLQSTVAGKADASALNSLTTRVEAAEGTITSQGNSITSVQATLGNMGGNGTNLLNDVYSWLTSTTLPPLAINAGLTALGVAVSGSASGFGVQVTSSSTSTGLYVEFTASNNAAGWNIPVVAGTYLVSAYLSSPTAGASCRVSLYDGTARYSASQALTTTRTRYTFPVVVTGSATTVGTVFYPNMGAASGTVVIIDSVMVEKQIGTSVIASPFTPGNSALSVTTNATAVSSLTARVTTAEGTIVSQGNAITGLTSTVAGKADTSALNSLTTRVTTAEGLITSQGNAITSLTSTVDGKADTSAVNALTTRVTAAEGTITSNSNSITSLNATVGGIGGTGNNLVPAEYSVFNATAPAFVPSAGTTVSTVVDSTAFTGYALKMNKPSGTGTVYFAPNNLYSGANIAVKNKKYIVSFYARSVVGQVIAVSARTITSAGVVRFSSSSQFTITDTNWVRYSAILDLTSALFVGEKMCLTINPANGTPDYNVDVFIDRVMLEEQVGTSVVPSSFAIGNSSFQNSATASAISALDARVTTAEGNITGQATSITNLNTSITAISGNGANLIDDRYSWLTSTTLPAMSNFNVSPVGIAVAGSPSGFGYQITATSAVTNSRTIFGVTNPFALTAGKYIISYYASANVAAQVQVGICDSGAANVVQGSINNVTTTRARYSALITIPADREGYMIAYINRAGTTGVVVTMDSIMIERQIGNGVVPSSFVSGSSAISTTANASATQSLTTRVTAAEGNITSQATSITNLSSSLGGAGTNLLSDTYSWLSSAVLPQVTLSTATSMTSVTVTGSPSGYGYRYVRPDVSNPWFMLCPTNNSAGWNVPLVPGNYLMSFYASTNAQGVTDGLSIRAAMWDGSSKSPTDFVLTATRTRYTAVITIPNSNTYGFTLFLPTGLSGDILWIDSPMIERQIATGVTPSPFVAGSSAASVSAKADASALTALTTRVTTAEGTLTTQGDSITSINTSIAGITSDNLVIDPTFNAGKAALINTSTVTIVARTDASVPANTSVPRVAQWAVPTQASSNTYLGWGPVVEQKYPGQNNFIAMAPGEVYEVSCDVFMEASGGTRQHGIWMQFYDAAIASIGHNWITGTISTTNGSWKTLTGVVTVPAGVVMGRPTLRASIGSATNIWIANMRWTKQTPVNAATASALSTLNATVTQQGTDITTTGSAVTALQNTVGGIGGSGNNINPSEYSVFGPLKPTIGAISTGLTVSTVLDAATLGGYALKFVSSTTSTTLACYLHASNTVSAVGSFPMSYVNGKYIVSYYAKSNTAGSTIRTWLRCLNATDVAVNSTQTTMTLTTSWVRYSHVVDLTNATTFSGSRMVFATYPNNSGVSGTEIYFDRIMVEKLVGENTAPSVFDAGSSYTSTTAQATAISSLDTRITTTEGIVSAQATKLDGVFLQVNPAMSGDSSGFAGDDSATVGVWTEQTARIDDDIAIGKRVDSVMAQVEDTLAVIQTESIARATADTALATTIDRVQVSANNANAAVQTVSQAQVAADGKASAMWSVKLQVNQWGQYAVAGVGLGLENTGAGLQSYFLVNANNFYISNGVNANVAVPFAVVGGQTFISSAVIQDASITMLKIGDNLQSDNYVAGTSGWRMLKSGVFEINGNIAGQGRMTMTNRSLRVYDGNGVKRVQLGDLSE